LRYTPPMVDDTTSLPDPAISAIVLAGGQSMRLGKDKSLLEVGGQPIVVRTVRTLACLSDDLIIVTNDPARYEPLALPVRLVPDEEPGVGSLMGIYSGLKAARHDYALVVACDMPLLDLPLLRYMLPLAEDHDIVIPRVGDLLEPLHAIYGKSCLSAMTRLLEQGRRQIIAFYDEVRVRYVDKDEIDAFDPLHLSFVNVNTPEDWERAERLLRTRASTRSNCRR
jgi:molybdopterin-guanine dinucleotide biosynthesis protein A